MYITQNKPLPLTYLQQKTDYLNNNQRISLERFLTVDVSFTNRAHRSWRNQQHVISSCVQHSPYYLLQPPSQGQWHVTPQPPAATSTCLTLALPDCFCLEDKGLLKSLKAFSENHCKWHKTQHGMQTGGGSLLHDFCRAI